MESLITNKTLRNNIVNNLETFCNDQTFSDLTLICEDDVAFDSHSLVLISHSTFFQSMLSSEGIGSSQPKQILLLPGIFSTDLKLVLELIYTGNCCVSKTQSNTVISILKLLQIEDSGIYVAEKISLNEEETTMKTNYIDSNVINEPNIQHHEDQSKTILEEIDPNIENDIKAHKNDIIYMNEEEIMLKTNSINSIGINEPNIQHHEVQSKAILEEIDLNIESDIEAHRNDIIYTCGLCPEVMFQSKNSKIRHVNAIHGTKKFTCAICGHVYTRKDALLRHLTNHHGIIRAKNYKNKSSVFECDKCKCSFQNNKDFKFHGKMKHKITKHSKTN